eukprot:6202348-Pleurochrysis_carterae.AAC.1
MPTPPRNVSPRGVAATPATPMNPVASLLDSMRAMLCSARRLAAYAPSVVAAGRQAAAMGGRVWAGGGAAIPENQSVPLHRAHYSKIN